MIKFKIGDLAWCYCGKQIEYIGLCWRHAIGGVGIEYRHEAEPTEPITEEEIDEYILKINKC